MQINSFTVRWNVLYILNNLFLVTALMMSTTPITACHPINGPRAYLSVEHSYCNSTRLPYGSLEVSVCSLPFLVVQLMKNGHIATE